MKYLLDTCVLLWSIEGSLEKIEAFQKKIEDENVPVFVSIVSLWEITIKKCLKKLTVPENFVHLVHQSGFEWLSLNLHHIQKLEQLPMLHHDPFDRLLIAQALADGFLLLTPDRQILQYTQ